MFVFGASEELLGLSGSLLLVFSMKILTLYLDFDKSNKCPKGNQLNGTKHKKHNRNANQISFDENDVSM